MTIGTLAFNTALNVVQEYLAFRQLRRLAPRLPPELSADRLTRDRRAPVRAATPLQVTVGRLLRILLIIAWVAAAWLLLNLVFEPPDAAQDVGQIYLDAISIIFSVAPSGLFFMVTLTHFFTVGDVARWDVLLKAPGSAETLAYVDRVQVTDPELLALRTPSDPPVTLADLGIDAEVVTGGEGTKPAERAPGPSDLGLALLTRRDPPPPSAGGPAVIIVPIDAAAAAVVDAGAVLVDRGVGTLAATIARCRRSIGWLADVLALTLAQIGYLFLLSLVPILGLAGLSFPAAANGIVTILSLTIPGIALFLMQGPTRSDPTTIADGIFRFAVPAALGTAAATMTTHVAASMLGRSEEAVLLASTLTLLLVALSLVMFVRPPSTWWRVRQPPGPTDRRSALVVGLMAAAYLVTVRVPLAQESFKVGPLLAPGDYVIVAISVLTWILVIRQALRRGWTRRASEAVRGVAEGPG